MCPMRLSTTAWFEDGVKLYHIVAIPKWLLPKPENCEKKHHCIAVGALALR